MGTDGRKGMEKELYGVCPYFTAQKTLQGKWSILIMHYLSTGPVPIQSAIAYDA